MNQKWQGQVIMDQVTGNMLNGQVPTSDTTHITLTNLSNNVNDYYVDDLRIELWYPEELIFLESSFYSNSTGAATG